MTFSKDETIFEQGEAGNKFFLLVEGDVAVIIDGKEAAQLKATPEKAPFFGEKALMDNAPRAATIKILSATARTLFIRKETFEMLLGSMKELMSRGKDGTSAVQKVA